MSTANPQKRAAFVSQFQQLFERLCQGEIRLVYLDEAHLHQDLDLGYTWAAKGEPTWRKSSCPPLSARLNWYGAYDFSEGRCFIWHEGACNGDHILVLNAMRLWWLYEHGASWRDSYGRWPALGLFSQYTWSVRPRPAF